MRREVPWGRPLTNHQGLTVAQNGVIGARPIERDSEAGAVHQRCNVSPAAEGTVAASLANNLLSSHDAHVP